MDLKKTTLSRLTSVLEGFEKSLMGFIDRQVNKRREMQLMLEQSLREKEHLYKQYNQAVEDVDRILMQLEVARRERDVALRNQGLNPQQKQAIARLERDVYRVSEALERVDGIRSDVRKMIQVLCDNMPLDQQLEEFIAQSNKSSQTTEKDVATPSHATSFEKEALHSS
jgi:hypothetical protein